MCPIQELFFLNSDFVRKQAEFLNQRLSGAGAEKDKIKRGLPNIVWPASQC